MDIPGLAKALSTCISDISKSLSKKSDELSNKQTPKMVEEKLPCDTCGKQESILRMNYVLGGICVCATCSEKIISFYVSNSPVKALCPFCNVGEMSIQKDNCKYCDLPSPVIDVIANQTKE